MKLTLAICGWTFAFGVWFLIGVGLYREYPRRLVEYDRSRLENLEPIDWRKPNPRRSLDVNLEWGDPNKLHIRFRDALTGATLHECDTPTAARSTDEIHFDPDRLIAIHRQHDLDGDTQLAFFDVASGNSTMCGETTRDYFSCLALHPSKPWVVCEANVEDEEFVVIHVFDFAARKLVAKLSLGSTEEKPRHLSQDGLIFIGDDRLVGAVDEIQETNIVDQYLRDTKSLLVEWSLSSGKRTELTTGDAPLFGQRRFEVSGERFAWCDMRFDPSVVNVTT